MPATETKERTATTEAQVKEAKFEIKLVPDERLNLAYNANYTANEKVRDSLLMELAEKSKRGGRLRCWVCSELTVELSQVRMSKGSVVVAQCNSCNSWCVMQLHT